MSSSSGTSPAGRRSHSARSAARPERARGRLGVRERGDGRRHAATAGVPSALMTTASTGLSAGQHATAGDRGGDLLGARDHRRDEEHDQRVDAGSASSGGNAASYVVAGRRAEQVDGVRDARLAPAASSASASRVSSPSSAARGRRLACVGAEDPEPAGVREHGDASPTGQRLASTAARPRRSAPRAIRARTTPAWRNTASTAASEPASAAVCELAARCARTRRPALHREDRLLARDPPRERAEPARVAERLEVEQHDLGRPGRPPTTRAGRSTRRPPCSRSRRMPRARARATAPARAARARARRSATRSRCCPAARRGAKVAFSRARRRRFRGSSARAAEPRARGRARAGAPAAPRPRSRSRRTRPRSRRAP